MYSLWVAAAETTKTVTWSGDDTVIKVDLGEKLVVAAPTATVTLDATSDVCEGDTNGDGYIDGNVYAINPELNAEQGWLYTNAKYWPTNQNGTAKHYLGLMGGRFLAPGSAEIEEDVFVNQLTHTVYNSEEECFNALAEAGVISVTRNEDGEIATVVLDYTPEYHDDAETILDYVTYKVVKTADHRKSEEAIIEAVVNYYVNGKTLTTVEGIFTVAEMQNDTVRNDEWKPSISVKLDGTQVTTVPNDDALAYYGRIVTVNSGKRGYTSVNTGTLVGQARKTYKTNLHDVEETLTKTAVKDLKDGDKYVLEGDNTVYTFSATAPATTATASDLADVKSVYVVTVDEGETINNTLTQSTYDVKEDLTAGTVYMADANTSFTTEDIKYYDYALDKEDNEILPVNNDYVVTTSGAIDGLAYLTVDYAGNYSVKVVDYTDTDIYVMEDGELTKVTAKTAKDLWKAENLAKFYIGTKPLSKTAVPFDDATRTVVDKANLGTKGYAAVIEGDLDYVSYDRDGLAVDGFYDAHAKYADVYVVSNRFVYSCDDKVTAGSLQANEYYNQLTKLGKPGYVTVVDIAEADTKEDGTLRFSGASVVGQFEVESFEDYELESNYVIEIEDFDVEFKTVPNALPTGETTFEGKLNTKSIYELVDIPENDTEYYVLLTDRAGLDLTEVWSYSKAYEIGTLTLANGEELECKAVQLQKNGTYYPAFETEEELVEAVYALTGLTEALEGDKDTKSTFQTWYKAAAADVKAGIAGLPEGEELPVTAIQPTHNAKKCDYTVTSTSDKVTVEATNTIDTTVAGVYDLEYAAKYEGEVVGTTSIKVVVAPNYTRTWENGRVKTLTSYYVSNPTAKYAEYNYNWAAGTATVTYYTVDGAVADTATITL